VWGEKPRSGAKKKTGPPERRKRGLQPTEMRKAAEDAFFYRPPLGSRVGRKRKIPPGQGRRHTLAGYLEVLIKCKPGGRGQETKSIRHT